MSLPLLLTIFAIHATDVLPEQDVVKVAPIPGRMTLHFSLGELVPPTDDGQSWEECCYAVVTPLSALTPQLINVNCYDTFIVGHLQLTDEMFLVAPHGCDTCHSTVTYDPAHQSLRQAVKTAVLDRNGLDIELQPNVSENKLNPAYHGGDNINTPDYFAPLLEQQPNLSMGLRWDPYHGTAYQLGQLELLVNQIVPTPRPSASMTQLMTWHTHLNQLITNVTPLPKLDEKWDEITSLVEALNQELLWRTDHYGLVGTWLGKKPTPWTTPSIPD